MDKDKGTSSIRDIKEQEIYFGTIPFMTHKGTFIINGTERVVVSQLHRSSGVFFDHDKGKTHSSGKVIYTSRIIPVRGSWIDMEVDPKDIVYIRIDRRRKFPVTLLFKAFGYSTEDLLSYFYEKEKIYFRDGNIYRQFEETHLKGQRASLDIENPETGEVLVKKGRMFTIRAMRQMKACGLAMFQISEEDLFGKVLAHTIWDTKTRTPLLKANEEIDQEALDRIREEGIEEFEVVFAEGQAASDCIRKTLQMDKVENKEEALLEIYRRLRPGNPATIGSGAGISRQPFLQVLVLRSVRCRPIEDQSSLGRRYPHACKDS